MDEAFHMDRRAALSSKMIRGISPSNVQSSETCFLLGKHSVIEHA